MPRKRAETIDTVCYDGKAIIEFHPGRHYYTCSVPYLEKWHVYQVGVTTAIGIKDKSAALQHWTAAQCEVYVQNKVAENQKSYLTNEAIIKIAQDMKGNYRTTKAKAAEVGVVVHDYLHEALLSKQNKQPSPVRPSLTETMDSTMLQQANNSIDAGLTFFEKNKLVPLTMERPTWSPRHGYLGTGDFIGLVNDELAVVDYKTSKKIYVDIFLQTAAYQCAYKEEFPDCGHFSTRLGVNVGKDGQLTTVSRGQEFYEHDLAAFLAAKELWHWDRVENGGWPIEIVGSLDGVPVSNTEEEW